MSSKRSETVGALVKRAFTWLQDAENQAWVEAASMGFFQTVAERPTEAQQWLMSLFPAWLLFDHRGPDSKTGLQRFEERFKDEIPKAERKLLQRLTHERFRLVEVSEVQAGQSITLLDLTSQEPFEVQDAQAADKLQPGTPCFVRLHRLGGQIEVDALAVLPPTIASTLRQRLTALADELRGEGELSEEDLFRDHAPRVFDKAIALIEEFAPPREVQQMPAAEREVMEKAIVDHFERWVDAPLESLGGQSPREAAKDPELSKELATVLRELEQRVAGDDRVKFDFAALRKELGID